MADAPSPEMMPGNHMKNDTMSEPEVPCNIDSESGKRPASPVQSCVSMSSNHSKDTPLHFRLEPHHQEREKRSGSPVLSCVSMSSDHSKDTPLHFSDEPYPQESDSGRRSSSPVQSCVSMSSDHSKDTPLHFRNQPQPQESDSGRRSSSPVQSCVSMSSDHSKDTPLHFRNQPHPQESESGKRSGSPVQSCVSMSSDHSKDTPLHFRDKPPNKASESGKRSGSPVQSCVSMSSDHSKDTPLHFRNQPHPQESDSGRRSSSPVQSCVSMSSDHSKDTPLHFRNQPHPQESEAEKRSGSPEQSCMSVRTDHSKDTPLHFKDQSQPKECANVKETEPSGLTNTPVNSDNSSSIEERKTPSVKNRIRKNFNLADTACTPKKRAHPKLPSRGQTASQETVSQKSELTKPCEKTDKKIEDSLGHIFKDVKNNINFFIEHDLEMFKRYLRKQNTDFYGDIAEEKWGIREGVLKMTLYFLRQLNHDDIADKLEDELIGVHQRVLKSKLIKTCSSVREGIAKKGESKGLNKIYTDLYITEGGTGEVNTDHDVRHIQKQNTRVQSNETQMQEEIQIECKSMFESPDQDKHIRTVLTQGVAGIGKSICIQKLLLDWAEGKEYQDITFIFPLPFRELNLKKGCYSLMDLIYQFFPETKGLKFREKYKVLFIFDGLDECRLPLKFLDNETWTSESMAAPLDVLLTNLIKGNLLPNALIWITTRPAAAAKIPAEHVGRVTEIRGFNDDQKVEYFRKKISDEKLAEKIIDHIKKTKTMFIMCHIPVFCWISAMVLERILGESRNEEHSGSQTTENLEGFAPSQEEGEKTQNTLEKDDIPSQSLYNNDESTKAVEKNENTPQTLTQMYTHFLIAQTIQGNIKYHGKHDVDVSWDKEVIQSLGELAFKHLKQNSLVFYEDDLEKCKVDTKKLSLYSGVCTMDTGRFLGRVYSFVHLSIQEFIAALYTFMCHRNEFQNVLVENPVPHSGDIPDDLDHQGNAPQQDKNEAQMIEVLKFAVDKALESENGHLDLFLRFLLGLSLESIQPFLRGLLKDKENYHNCKDEIIQYIKIKLNDNLSPERSINLFYCLNELNDDSLVKEMQKYVNSGLAGGNLSPAQWSALVFVLLTSDKDLNVFDLKKYIRSDECLKRLLPVVQRATKALLNECNLTERSCSALLIEVLSKSSCSLTELNMSCNALQDSGVKILCDGLKNPNSKLEILGLSDCSITGAGYTALADALKSNPTLPLKKLDLRGNDPGDEGVKLLTHYLKDSNYKLEILRLLKTGAAVEARAFLSECLGADPLLERELDLTKKIQGDSKVKKISHLLEDSHCRVKILKLCNCTITEEGSSAIASALNKNPSHLMELDLSGNQISDLGVKRLSELLENSECALKHLRLSYCSITGEGYTALALALTSSPSSKLVELELSGNDPGDEGVKVLTELINNSECKLQKLRLLKTPAAEEAFAFLTGYLGTNPLLLKDLDLSGKIEGDLGVKKISHILEDLHCRVNKLKLCNNGITKEGCTALSAALISNPSHLRELDLSGNQLRGPAVQELSKMFSKCKLDRLKLSDCSITGEGYAALAEALQSSHPIELDLSGNDPGDEGVMLLSRVSSRNLKTLRLLKTQEAEEAFVVFKELLSQNPLLLKELDMREIKCEDSRVKQLSYLLEDLHCRVKTLKLSNCSVTEEGCAAVASALCKNPSHLKELDLSENEINDSGVKLFSGLLQNSLCYLEQLKLCDCSITEEGCAAVASALRKNPSHLKELDLSENEIGDSGMKQISLLLENSHCNVEHLKLCNCSITEEGCAAVVSVLGKNPSHLKKLDLSGNKVGDSGVEQLSDLLQNSLCNLETLILSDCSISGKGYNTLAKAVKSNSSSQLTLLDLSGNNPGDEGVKLLTQINTLTLRLLKSPAAESCDTLTRILGTNPLLLVELNLSEKIQGDLKAEQLSAVLEDLHCRVKTLKLCNVSITASGCAAVASSLSKNPSHLKELDLSRNEIGDSGLKKLSDLLGNCKLTSLVLCNCGITIDGCAAVSSATNFLHLKELDLSGNKVGDSGVEHICALLQNLLCNLEKLRLSDCSATHKCCGTLRSAIPPPLKELDLSDNKIEDSGVAMIAELFKNPNCNLEKLTLSRCCITSNGYTTLEKALKSVTSSHLRELDLRGNNPGSKGVHQLTELKDRHPNLTLSLLQTKEAEKACDFLTKLLGKNPLLQKELDLSEKIHGDSDVKLFSDLLGDSQCTVTKLILRESNITANACSALGNALCSNPTHLTELDLSGNQLKDSGVKYIALLLKKSSCKLSKLKLSYCSITGGGYYSLASALESNPSSQLVELDLRGNDPGDKGVKQLTDLQTPSRKLKELRLLKSPDAQEVWEDLVSRTNKNPLLEKELKLRKNMTGITGDSRVQKLSALLQDPHCKWEKLQICCDDLTVKSCLALAAVLSSSCLKELDLSYNNLQNSGVRELCEELKNPLCKLEILRLSDCSITGEGYAALASALRSNSSSQLLELDLRGNNPGDDGVKLLTDLFKSSFWSRLDLFSRKKTLRFLKNDAAEACDSLEKILGKNPLLERELDLSYYEPKKVDVQKLCALLKDPHCRMQKLKLYKKDTIKGDACADLISALTSNLSHLKELNLNGNKLSKVGMENLCSLLISSQCKLQKLSLSNSVTVEACADLASALCSNPLYIKELDLSENSLGESGIRNLSPLLKNTSCKLEKLLLRNCSIEDEACTALASDLKLNYSHLRELDLTGNKLADSVKWLYELQRDLKCNILFDENEKSSKGSWSFTGRRQDSTTVKNKKAHSPERDLYRQSASEMHRQEVNDLTRLKNQRGQPDRQMYQSQHSKKNAGHQAASHSAGVQGGENQIDQTGSNQSRGISKNSMGSSVDVKRDKTGS